MLIKTGLTYQKVEPYAFNTELKSIKHVVNGWLQFGDLEGNNKNFYGTLVEVEFPLLATDVQIPHQLISVPIGYLVIKNNNGTVIYDGNTAWDKTNIYLRSTLSNSVVTIFILG